MPRKAAYTTLLTKDSYLPGTLTLDYCLKSVQSQYPLVVLITPTLPQRTRDALIRRNIEVREILPLQPEDGQHSLAGFDERFADTWTKLRVFELVDYDRVVLMDSDMIVMRNMDELMELDLPKDWIAAAHACACNPRKLPHYPKDWIPKNCAYTPLLHPTGHTQPSLIEPFSPQPYNLLNSGLVIITPSTALAKSIVHFLRTSPLIPTFTFPDQDLLAAFFQGKWKPLPWVYNALKTLRAVHKNLWRDEEVRCLHYILSDKPWKARIREGDAIDDLTEMDRWWWRRFDRLIDEMEDDPETQKLLLANVAN
ncbi:glycosyltransferase family 8 protein [Multifurca ochricompacta]|uniref:Glycosyltransferase family 8 protein n=1 Tax=Multifurca ochricompacta TaxID=376703 RepID=A0AAD4QTU6_9AGAM|nr:glycosyltransferase family 8 protein [Multifurca ochricompacta]